VECHSDDLRGSSSDKESGLADGFTIPEVLLALALLTVAAVAVGGAVRSSLDLIARAREVAQPPIGWSIGRDALLRAGSIIEVEEGGRISLPDGSRVRWDANVEETDMPDLFFVEFEVEAEEREKKEEILLFRPSWSQAIDRGPLMNEARKDIEDSLKDVER